MLRIYTMMKEQLRELFCYCQYKIAFGLNYIQSGYGRPTGSRNLIMPLQ